jgi:phenol hydroxylase P0 protein
MAEPSRPAAHVRILGVRSGKFIEFEYSLDDGLLAIELILPLAAFEEFCRAQDADVLQPDPETAETIERMSWRAGQPGLLRRTRRDDP